LQSIAVHVLSAIVNTTTRGVAQTYLTEFDDKTTQTNKLNKLNHPMGERGGVLAIS